jgi:hypothetical protein
MIVPHRTHPCDTRASGDAIMLSCGNELARQRGGGTSKKTKGVKLRPAARLSFAKCDIFWIRFCFNFNGLGRQPSNWVEPTRIIGQHRFAFRAVGQDRQDRRLLPGGR